jgi:CheY-like chemotaxis protein
MSAIAGISRIRQSGLFSKPRTGRDLLCINTEANLSATLALPGFHGRQTPNGLLAVDATNDRNPATGNRRDVMRLSARESASIDIRENVHAVVEFQSSDEIPRILIADDDPSIVRLLADHCARMGFDVDTASNGIQALLKASRTKPDTLVIDVNMPEVDGLSVCAHLLDPDRAPINVIVMTGSRNPDTLERCEGFGAFYARKGPKFWEDLEAALTEIHPRMGGRIRQSGMAAPAPAVRRRPRVLLVDDDSDINRFLTSRLEKCGVDVQYACNAQQGFRMACRDEPAAIVSDYFMPNGDAQYLLARLRTTAATEKIPVIVLSGRQLNDITQQNLRREICGHPGATQILRKSADTGALFEALRKFCGFERPHPAGYSA